MIESIMAAALVLGCFIFIMLFGILLELDKLATILSRIEEILRAR